MKILELAPYVYIEGHSYGEKNKSGLAYMIRSICDMLATKNDVHLLTQSLLTDKATVSGWHLVKRNYWTILKNFKFSYFRLALRLIKKNGWGSFSRVLLYCISGGQVESYIKKWKPDVVHIHGIGLYTLPYYYAASKMSVPVVATLHGLVSFNDIVPVSPSKRKLERLFLGMCVSNGYSLTFISSGMKRKVQSFTNNECSNISVIPNCYRSLNSEPVPPSSVIEKDRHLICIGSLYPLKNQIQVIKILPKMKNRMGEERIILDIYGDGPSMIEWKNYCSDNHIDDVIFHGRVSQREVFTALAKADVLVFPSIEEGFGIPIVEAYSCGIPVVTYRDLDASEDIANNDCVVFAQDRSEDSLVNAIEIALTKHWDKETIRTFARRFSLDAISQKYCNVFNKNNVAWSWDNVKQLLKDYLRNE